MSGGLLGGDPSKKGKPFKMLSSEEQRELDKEIQELIDEALGGRAARHLRGERQKNEAEIAAFVDQLLADELISVEEKKLPPEKTRNKYMATFREFAEWCRTNGVDALPCAGQVVFFWLVQAPDKIAQRVRALRYVFDISREHLDERYIATAERYARIVKTKTEKEEPSH